MLLVGALVPLHRRARRSRPPINGARRWFLVGPDQRAAVRARQDRRLRLDVRAARPATDAADAGRADEAARARRRRSSASSILLEPDLGTTIALCLMVGGILLVSERAVPAARASAATIALGARRGGDLRRAVPARALLQLPRPDGRIRRAPGSRSVQAIIGMGSGGITGEGLGQGISKIFYLPEAHTDMIFAIVGEELGLIGLDRRDRGVRRLRVGRVPHRARTAATRSASGSRPGSRPSSAGRP